MAENYIVRMKRENELLKAENAAFQDKLGELEKKVEKVVETKEMTLTEPLPSIIDDRDEIVTVSMGITGSTPQGQPVYGQYQYPKREALEKLVDFYIGRRNKMIPSPDKFDTNRNNTTCYVRLTKRDLATGRKLIATQDMPLWIAAERAVEGKAIEIITKQEYEKYHNDRDKQFQAWKKEQYAVKKAQLMDSLQRELD